MGIRQVSTSTLSAPQRVDPAGTSRFLILEDFPSAVDIAQDVPPLRQLLPMLRFCLVKEDRFMRWLYGEPIRPCELYIYAPVGFEALVAVIRSATRVRHSDNPGGSILTRVNKVTIEQGGQVLCTPPPDPSRLKNLRSAVFQDRISFVVNGRGHGRTPDDFAHHILSMFKLLLPDWSKSNASSLVHVSCTETVIPDIMTVVSPPSL